MSIWLFLANAGVVKWGLNYDDTIFALETSVYNLKTNVNTEEPCLLDYDFWLKSGEKVYIWTENLKQVNHVEMESIGSFFVFNESSLSGS